MSRRRGSSIKRLSCLQGQEEGNEYDMESRAGGEGMRSEMKYLKSTLANFDSKLNRLLTSSDRELQLASLTIELKEENCELKVENKRLDRNNRESEKQLIVATNNYKNLTEKYTSATEMVDVLNERVKDLMVILEKYRKERTDVQHAMTILNNNLKSQLQTIEKDEGPKLHTPRKRHELNRNALCDKLLDGSERISSETKIMKLEMKLFRRNKLIEVLMERLRSSAPEFSLSDDVELASYIDDDLPHEVQLSECDDASQISSASQLTLETDVTLRS